MKKRLLALVLAVCLGMSAPCAQAVGLDELLLWHVPQWISGLTDGFSAAAVYEGDQVAALAVEEESGLPAFFWGAADLEQETVSLTGLRLDTLTRAALMALLDVTELPEWTQQDSDLLNGLVSQCLQLPANSWTQTKSTEQTEEGKTAEHTQWRLALGQIIGQWDGAVETHLTANADEWNSLLDRFRPAVQKFFDLPDAQKLLAIWNGLSIGNLIPQDLTVSAKLTRWENRWEFSMSAADCGLVLNGNVNNIDGTLTWNGSEYSFSTSDLDLLAGMLRYALRSVSENAFTWRIGRYFSTITARLDVHRFVQEMRSALVYAVQEYSSFMRVPMQQYASWFRLDVSKEELQERIFAWINDCADALLRMLPPLQVQLNTSYSGIEGKITSGGYALKVRIQEDLLDASVQTPMGVVAVSGAWSSDSASFSLTADDERMWLAAHRENSSWLADVFENEERIAQAVLRPGNLSVTIPDNSMYTDWAMNLTWTDASLHAVLPEVPAEVILSANNGLYASVKTDEMFADGRLCLDDGLLLEAQWNLNGSRQRSLNRFSACMMDRKLDVEYHETLNHFKASEIQNEEKNFCFQASLNHPRRLYADLNESISFWQGGRFKTKAFTLDFTPQSLYWSNGRETLRVDSLQTDIRRDEFDLRIRYDTGINQYSWRAEGDVRNGLNLNVTGNDEWRFSLSDDPSAISSEEIQRMLTEEDVLPVLKMLMPEAAESSETQTVPDQAADMTPAVPVMTP